MPPAKYRSNFTASKIIAIWLALLATFVFPWVVATPQIKEAVVFPMLIDVLILAVIWYVKIPLEVIIRRPENIIEYHWMKLWGQKRQVCIDINKASFYVGKAASRGGKLDRLTIIDGDVPDNKITITEVTDGFDGDQIWYMHYELRQIRVEHGLDMAADQ